MKTAPEFKKYVLVKNNEPNWSVDSVLCFVLLAKNDKYRSLVCVFVKEIKPNVDKYVKLCLLSRRLARYLSRLEGNTRDVKIPKLDSREIPELKARTPLLSFAPHPPPHDTSLFSLDSHTLSPARRPKKTLRRCSSESRRGETCDTRSNSPSQVCEAPGTRWSVNMEAECRKPSKAALGRVLAWYWSTSRQDNSGSDVVWERLGEACGAYPTCD